MVTTYRIRAAAAATGFLLLALLSELYVGLWERIVNIYVGDLFIVGWLYFLVALCWPKLKPVVTGAIIFGVALSVELFQATGIPARPETPGWIVFWIGNVFDPLDIVVYPAGILLAMIADVFFRSPEQLAKRDPAANTIK
jgi:hypothetical protein